MTLYHAPFTCSLFPLVVLHELGAPFELVRVDLRTKRTESGEDFLSINPRGKVPALRLPDGQVLTEGPAIAQLLVPPPVDPLERARLQEWLNFLTSDLHKSFGVYFQPTAGEAHLQATRQYIASQLMHVEQALSRRPFLMGEAFGIADAYLFTITGWAMRRRIDLSAMPHLRAFYERVSARPAVAAALREEA